MFGTTKKAHTDDKFLGLDIESLEERKMLAADVTVVGGDSLRITGDNTSEAVSVSMNDAGFVTVDGQSTGLTQLDNLTINMRGGNDNVIVNGSGSNALNVTGRTTIRLGSGANQLNIGGQHNSLRISGGRDADRIYASHQIRNASTTISLRGGNDAFSFDTGMISDANSNGRVDLSRFSAGFNTGSLPKLSLNLGGGDDLVSMSHVGGGQETSIPDSEFRPDDVIFLFAGASLNGASGSDTLSPLQMTDTLTVASGIAGTSFKRFENSADLSNDVPGETTPTPIDASVVFSQPTYDAIVANINVEIPGTGTTLLTNALDILHTEAYFDQLEDPRPTSGQITQALTDIASARNLSVGQVTAQYTLFNQLKQDRDLLISSGQQEAVDALGEIHRENFLGPDFMGSKGQLRYGELAGDVLGLDPVFGALLNPTGGLVGPGNSSLNLGDSAISLHGSVHDAAGYLLNYHNEGPGYNYLGTFDPFDTTNPLSGQANGLAFWNAMLGETAEFQEIDSATATDTLNNDFAIQNVFSDTNLTAANFLTTPSSSNAWVSNARNGFDGDYFDPSIANDDPQITFDLGFFNHTVSKVAIWGYTQFDAFGNDVKDFTLEFSTNLGVTYDESVSLTKPMVTSDNFVTIIDLGGEFQADEIRMTIHDNHAESALGGNHVGFNQIRFLG